MPPKTKKNEPSKKTEQKAKAKVIEDKTFGMKNKKGTKQQKYIQQVQKTVLSGSKSAKQLAKEQDDKLSRKEQKKKEKDELNSLFKPVEQKVTKGVDPKSVLCAFFKAGSCTKGDKCKFSHDLNIARKGEKKNIYGDEKKEDNMEDWDEEKLEDVVNKKHGESNKKKMETKIICKFFLDAVENSKYGWFWDCPNGKECHYKHCLPPGFVLKKDKKKAEDGQVKISLEELIEKERAALNSQNLTAVTLESFLKWKAKKKKEKIAAMKKDKDSRKKDFKAGKALGQISGREMFEFNPDLIMNEIDDEEETGGNVDLSSYAKESDDEEEAEKPVKVKDIDLEALAASASEVDGSGTKRGEAPPPADAAPTVNGLAPEKPAQQHQDEAGKLDMAAGGAPSDDPGSADAAIAAANAAIDVPIDENLFDEDDLLEIEEELETLDLED